MARLKAKELRKLEPEELRSRLTELASELSKLKSRAGRGALGKETGNIKKYKRDIARFLTVMREKGVKG